jgi:ATP-dependent protease HslVU (ClpYQ) peptidase subunit
MTIIVGLVDDGKVYLGADRGMSDKEFINSILTPKIQKVGPILIGYSSSQGTGQLAHFLQYPKPPTENLNKYLRTEFVKVLQKACEDYNVDVNDEDKAAADFVVGVHGHLFEISTTDWSVAEYDHIATGSGYGYALGSLHATSDFDITPRQRIKMAVEASIRYSPSCSGPVDILVQ